MERIKINGKEIEFDEKELKPLSEEALKSVAGGFIMTDYGTIILYRYECYQCGAHGPWFDQESSSNPEVSNVTHRDPSCKGRITCQPHIGRASC